MKELDGYEGRDPSAFEFGQPLHELAMIQEDNCIVYHLFVDGISADHQKGRFTMGEISENNKGFVFPITKH